MSYNEKDEKILDTTTVVPVQEDANYELKGEHGIHADGRGLDAAAALAAKIGSYEVDPAEAKRVLKKIDRHLLPLMMALYAMQFIDKTTLGNSSVLGIKTDCNLTTTQYNMLGSLFYIAYLALEWPQNLALQRFPVGKWMAGNITFWAIVLACHAACNNFAGLAALRFLLGTAEGCITAGFMIVTSMFYTHAEQARRVGYWFLMNGTAQVVSGLLSYGVLQSGLDKAFKPWRIFFLLCSGMTFIVAIAYWIWFPDSPTTARWLTEEDKIIAVERIRVNQTGVENKVWKKEQFIEALCDWKLWAFALMAALNNVPNSLTNQNSLIIKSLGYEVWQTTLLGCVSGVVEIVTIYASTLALKKWPNYRGYIGAIWMIPNILGGILVITLPWSNKAGILVSLYITGVGTPGFVIALAWVNSSVTGHTKKTTTNAAFLIGYCLGNLLAPLMWLDKYKPRNILPWGVIIGCYTCCVLIMLGIRMRMSYENRMRDKEQAERSDEDEFGYIDEVQADGSKIVRKVDKAFLDLTDKQNRSFRYPL